MDFQGSHDFPNGKPRTLLGNLGNRSWHMFGNFGRTCSDIRLDRKYLLAVSCFLHCLHLLVMQNSVILFSFTIIRFNTLPIIRVKLVLDWVIEIKLRIMSWHYLAEILPMKRLSTVESIVNNNTAFVNALGV